MPSKDCFCIPCPKCGSNEALQVALHDLVVSCSECSETISRADLQRLIDDTARLLRWLDSAGNA